MTQPPFPLVCSGRRLPSAGPGRQVHLAAPARRGNAGLIVAVLAVLLIVGPDIVAVLSMVFAGATSEPSAQTVVPFHLVAILQSARVLVPLALAPSVIRATELE